MSHFTSEMPSSEVISLKNTLCPITIKRKEGDGETHDCKNVRELLLACPCVGKALRSSGGGSNPVKANGTILTIVYLPFLRYDHTTATQI